MTKREAKRLALELWDELRKNGGFNKYDVPEKLYKKIKDLPARCPLCAYFESCTDGCPLWKGSGIMCCDSRQPYFNWREAFTKEDKKYWANEVWKQIKEWEVK